MRVSQANLLSQEESDAASEDMWALECLLDMLPLRFPAFIGTSSINFQTSYGSISLLLIEKFGILWPIRNKEECDHPKA